MKNHSQTLEQLAENGGLVPGEAIDALNDRKGTKMPTDAAVDELKALVGNHKARLAPQNNRAIFEPDEMKAW